MATTNARVLFCFVPSGKTKPTPVDGNTIYFIEDSHEIHIGSNVIAQPTDLTNYETKSDIATDIQTALNTALAADISVTISGSGDTVTGAEYNSSTKVLTLTKSNTPTYTIAQKATPNSGAQTTYQLTKDGTAVGVDIDIPEDIDVPVYSVEKLATAESGYSASYQLTKDGTAVGDKINIPKDMVVSAAELKQVTTADQPYSGAEVDDYYIDLIIANATSDHIYIPVQDLVDVYTGGTHITVTDGEISHDSQGTNAATTLGTDSSTAIHVSGQVQYDSLGHVISVADKNIYSGVKTVADDEIDAALDDLKLTTVGGTNKYVASVSQEDGKVSATEGTIDTTATANSTNLVTSGAAYQAAQDAIAVWTVVS